MSRLARQEQVEPWLATDSNQQKKICHAKIQLSGQDVILNFATIFSF